MTDDIIESEWQTLDREKRRLQKIALDILKEFPIDHTPDCDDPDKEWKAPE